jgi:hypothetical protein
MQLAPKEQALVDRVIQKIHEFDPQAIVKIADETIEHEDVLILVCTDKPSLATIQHVVPYTGDILMNENLDILVVPEDRERVQDWGV